MEMIRFCDMLRSTKECQRNALLLRLIAHHALSVPLLFRFWVALWTPCWVTFGYFLWSEVSKSTFGLQVWLLMIFEWKSCWFLVSQPFRNIVNTMVFVRFHVFDFWLIFMISGTSWDLNLEVFGGLQASFWGFLRVLENDWNFNECYCLAGWTQNPEDLVRCW